MRFEAIDIGHISPGEEVYVENPLGKMLRYSFASKTVLFSYAEKRWVTLLHNPCFWIRVLDEPVEYLTGAL